MVRGLMLCLVCDRIADGRMTPGPRSVLAAIQAADKIFDQTIFGAATMGTVYPADHPVEDLRGEMT